MSTTPEALTDLIGGLIYARCGWGGLGQARQSGRAARVAADVRDGGRALRYARRCRRHVARRG